MTTAVEVVQGIICQDCELAARLGTCKGQDLKSCALFVRSLGIATVAMGRERANIAEDLERRAQLGETIEHVAQKYAEQAAENPA